MATAALNFCVFCHTTSSSTGDAKLQCVSLLAEILANEQDAEVCYGSRLVVKLPAAANGCCMFLAYANGTTCSFKK
jgi:hypothetical protein